MSAREMYKHMQNKINMEKSSSVTHKNREQDVIIKMNILMMTKASRR